MDRPVTIVSSIREGDRTLKSLWRERFLGLPSEARTALRLALLDLHKEAQERAQHQWRRHKAPMALYWKLIAVYAGHLARALALSLPASA